MKDFYLFAHFAKMSTWEEKLQQYATEIGEDKGYDACTSCGQYGDLYGQIPKLFREDYDTEPDPFYCEYCYNQLTNRNGGFVLEIVRLRALLRNNGIDPNPQSEYYDDITDQK